MNMSLKDNTHSSTLFLCGHLVDRIQNLPCTQIEPSNHRITEPEINPRVIIYHIQSRNPLQLKHMDNFCPAL